MNDDGDQEQVGDELQVQEGSARRALIRRGVAGGDRRDCGRHHECEACEQRRVFVDAEPGKDRRDEDRAGHQSQDSQNNRRDDPAECSGAGRQSDQVI